MTTKMFMILCVVAVFIILSFWKLVKGVAKLIAVGVVIFFVVTSGLFTNLQSSTLYTDAQQYVSLSKEYSSYVRVSNSKPQINVNGTWVNVSDIQEVSGSVVDSVNEITVKGQELKIEDSKLKEVLKELKSN